MFVVDIVVFLVVLGVLVFFHEMGHFIAAKACRIYCDRFSLGMPPRVWGIKIGETDYCVGALPIGGYVKMAGQEDAPKSDQERNKEYGHVPRERWFSNRPVWQRFVVVFSGPFMNLILGLLLYVVVAAAGAWVPQTKVDNRIGKVEQGAPAASAPMYVLHGEGEVTDFSRGPDAIGWKTGDRILTINGHRITSFADVAVDALLGKGKKLRVEIERTASDDSITRYLSIVEPHVVGDKTHAELGVFQFDAALVDFVSEDMPALESGIQPGDIVVRTNGELVDQQTLTERVEKTAPGEEMDLVVDRQGQLLPIRVPVKAVGRLAGIVFDPPLYADLAGAQEGGKAGRTLEVAGVLPEVREETGIQRKDIILEVNGQPATPALLRELEKTRPGETIEVTVKRPKLLFGWVQQEEMKTLRLKISAVGAIGIVYGQKTVFHRVPWNRVIPEAFRNAYKDVSRTLTILAQLVTGGVSTRDLGGPVLIYQLTTATAHMGYSWLFEMMALISISLCIFNLLPLPVLDGGLILFLMIEALRRKPLDLKVLERIQQVGLALIIALMLFVTYNDITRIISNYVP